MLRVILSYANIMTGREREEKEEREKERNDRRDVIIPFVIELCEAVAYHPILYPFTRAYHKFTHVFPM